MWALASHAKACNCDFVFLTDCGTGFDKDCLRFLLDPMLEDITIGVTSGYQRGMSAALQGCGKNEWWHNPGNFILRQGQIFDHELAYSSSKGLHNRLGFLSVVPGPCGLYRYDCLGSIESGIMKTYFELSTCAPQNQCDLILGNTQLAEDRFPPILLTLQTTAQCKTQGTTSPCPRAHFVPDAIYYFEAEIPLQSLVKQRRRWNNGAFFSAVWFLSCKSAYLPHVHNLYRNNNPCIHAFSLSPQSVVLSHEIADWLWQSNHSTFFKLVVLLTSGCETILVSLLFAIFMPPTIACSLYGSASGYLGGDIKIAFEPQKESIDLHSTMLALIPSLAYMLVYTVFIVGHIPRAVPVKQEQNQHTLDVELSNASEEAPAPPTQWRADHRSAYRPGLWRLAIATNVLASLCVLPWMIIALLYHVDEVSTMRWCMLVSLAIFYASVVSGICERRTPSLRAFWNLAVRFPLMLGLGGFSMMNWCQCYSFARISDLSWGNRAGAHDETVDTQVAKRRAHLGKLFALSLLFLNFVSYAAFSFWTIYDNRAVLYLIMMILAPSTFLMSLHGMASFYHGLRRLVSFTWKRVQLLMLLLLLLLLRCRRSSGFRSDGSDTMAPATVSGDHVVEDRDIEDTEFMSLNSTSLDSVSLNSASIRSSIDIIIYAGTGSR
jgi:hypothetical protein